MSENRDGGFGWFLFGFLLGGLVGAAIALAYAPEKGEQVRERLREKSIELQGRAQQTVGQVRERLTELGKQAQVQLGQVREQVEKGLQAVRPPMEEPQVAEEEVRPAPRRGRRARKVAAPEEGEATL